jgi:hypothetical protein
LSVVNEKDSQIEILKEENKNIIKVINSYKDPGLGNNSKPIVKQIMPNYSTAAKTSNSGYLKRANSLSVKNNIIGKPVKAETPKNSAIEKLSKEALKFAKGRGSQATGMAMAMTPSNNSSLIKKKTLTSQNSKSKI